MSVKRVSPQEALALLDEGYVYLDVRSVPEFEAGHPSGAYNIPLLHMTEAGMEPNPSFFDVLSAIFPPDSKLILGCRSGGRSLRAAQALMQAGYRAVIDQRAGFDGARGAFGQLEEPGWQPAGLDVATLAEEGRSYEALAKRAGKG